MYETVRMRPVTRTISTVGRSVTDANRPSRVYRSQVQTGVVAPGSYEVADIGLGFSLNPLKWIKSAVGAVKGVLSNSTVTLPTSQGSVTVKGGDLGSVIRGASVNVAGAQPTPTFGQQFTNAIESVPGGWLTVAGVGVGAAILVATLARRRG